MAKKTYVIDTSVFLTDSQCIYKYGINDIVIPLKVLEEIDKHKKRQDSVGANGRSIIRALDTLRKKGNLHRGVRLAKGKGLISIATADTKQLPPDLDRRIADHVIMSTALSIKQEFPNRRTIMVTRDINMRVICDSLGIESQDYISDQVVERAENIYSGFVECLVDDQIIDRFYNDEEVVLENSDNMYPNQFIMLISNANEKKTALAGFKNHGKPLRRLIKYKNGIWKVASRNKEQLFTMNLLMDPSIPVVSLVGRAGSGKTLCAIAAGLEQVMGNDMKNYAKGNNKEISYKRLIVSRPVQPLGKDIGFLPGTMEEKMHPWLMPIQDNLQFLMGDDRTTLEMYMEQGKIEIEALTYIRGRSISNAYIIIDEAQNLTIHEIKTIITRVGEGTKIVFTGDIEQIDNVYVNETTNGLTYAIEKLKASDLTGHITLQKGERSKVATMAAIML